MGRRLKHREILDLSKRKLKLAYEIKYSVISMIIFVVMGSFIYFLSTKELTQIYYNINEKSIFYLILSFFIIHQFHDLYFYWTHRWMHEVQQLKRIHNIHHGVTTPTPLAAYTFHPIEALIHTGFWFIVSFSMPISVHVLFIFFIFQTYINMWGHCCYEFWTVNLLDRWPWKALNTPTHHVLHHKYNKLNYGIYYNFWDKLCKTNHPKYREEYEAIKRKTLTSRQSKLLKIFKL